MSPNFLRSPLRRRPVRLPRGIELQAQRLVRKAGSVEGAKKAIDTALERESIGDFREDAFAARWGFSSRVELMTASQPLFTAEDSSWWATKLANGRWIVWGHDDLSANDTFASLEEAQEAVGDASRA
jgi:hypothetical protein